MGWLCSQCSTENGFRETRCRACLSRVSLHRWVSGWWITLYERLSANRLGRFAESVYDKMIKIVGGANSAVGIAAAIVLVCGAMAAVSMGMNHAAPEAVQTRLEQLVGRIERQAEFSVQAAAYNGQQIYESIEMKIDSFGEVPQRIDARSDMIAAAVGKWAERLENGGRQLGSNIGMRTWQLRNTVYTMGESAELIVRRVPNMDILAVNWLSERLGDVRDWAERIDWLDGAAQWLESVQSELRQTAREWAAKRM